MNLYDYQQELVNGIENTWASGARNVAAILPTGGGKTVVFSHVVAKEPGASCVIAHRQELVAQTSLALVRNQVRHRVIGSTSLIRWCHQQSVRESGHNYVDARARCATAGVDTLVRMNPKDPWFRSVALWVTDECFPAGTLVDGRPIEDIRVGDFVTAFNEWTGEFHKRPVVRIFKNPSPKHVVRLNGILECTLGHPIWTRRGWVPAGNLLKSDEVLIDDMLRMRSCGARSDEGPNRTLQKDRASLLQPGMLGQIPSENILRNSVTDEPQICLREDDAKQSDGACGGPKKSQSNIETDRPPTPNPRGQWETPECSRSGINRPVFGSQIHPAVSDKDQSNEKKHQTVADVLQTRFRTSGIKDCNRSGWEQPRFDKPTPPGSEKRPLPYWVRLDRIEVFERNDSSTAGRSETSGFVYNLEVEEFHTYLANGVVVHNCHHLLADNKWGRAVAMFPNARGLGVTATLERADGSGLGRPDGVLDAIVVGPPMRELIHRGRLCDFRIFDPPASIDRSKLPVSAGGDFSPEPLRAAIHGSRIVGDVVGHYLRLTPGQLGVSFCVDIESAVELAAAFRAAGVPAETVTGKTPSDLRYRLMQNFARGDFKQLCVVDIVSEGTDIPAIDVVSLARPSASYVLVAQQVGRALRTREGKSIATVIDHVGNIRQFARVAVDPVTGRSSIELDRASWSLERRERRSRGTQEGVESLRTCSSCLAPYPAIEGRTCPCCGTVSEPAARSTPEQVDGDLVELSPEALLGLTQEIARIDAAPVIYESMPRAVAGGVAKAHRERQVAQTALREAMAQWGGIQTAAGMDVRKAQRVFFHTFGVDVATAQTLGRPAAEELRARIIAKGSDI